MAGAPASATAIQPATDVRTICGRMTFMRFPRAPIDQAVREFDALRSAVTLVVIGTRNDRCAKTNVMARCKSLSIGPGRRMPRITDATAIRRRILAATWRVIATEGIQSVSMRRVARAAGSTTGLITHYFKDKDELITRAYRTVLDRMIADAARRIAAPGNVVERLLAAVEAIEPTGPEMQELTVVLMNFWAQAACNPAYARYCRHDYRRWRTLIGRAIRDGIASGELRRDTDVRMLCDVLTIFSDGLSVGITLTPRAYPRAQRAAILRRLLAPYLNDSGRIRRRVRR
jgi:TetR/AcrR family transcriptional repressor of bet genes